MHKKRKVLISPSPLCLCIWMSFALNVYAKEPMNIVPPAIVPVTLKNNGEIVDAQVQIADHHIYYFSLRFSFRKGDQADRSRVRLLTGGHETDRSGKALHPGVPTPFQLRVAKTESGREYEVFSKEIDPILTSWGGDNFKKEIGRTELRPGTYRVRLKLLQATPAFEGTPVAFSIGYDKFKTKVDAKK